MKLFNNLYLDTGYTLTLQGDGITYSLFLDTVTLDALSQFHMFTTARKTFVASNLHQDLKGLLFEFYRLYRIYFMRPGAVLKIYSYPLSMLVDLEGPYLHLHGVKKVDCDLLEQLYLGPGVMEAYLETLK